MSWKHGCCVDREYFVKTGRGDKGCTQESCMELPAGKTCGDCRHVNHCKAFYAVKPDRTYCDFFPRRFLERKAAVAT